jgi:hypothetical protein
MYFKSRPFLAPLYELLLRHPSMSFSYSSINDTKSRIWQDNGRNFGPLLAVTKTVLLDTVGRRTSLREEFYSCCLETTLRR